MKYPSPHTKLVVLFGLPLEHSYSSRMHNRVFAKLNMDYLYLPVEVTAENLPAVFAGLIKMNVVGFNVTIPHKIRIMGLLDSIDPLAAAIGAVNTISIQNGHTVGYNTDGIGFLQALESETNISVANKSVFMLGCGGAARSIAMTFASRGVAKVFLYNRTISKAEDLSQEINTKIRNCAYVVPPTSTEMTDALRSSHILVNCTSIGMYPHSDEIPIDANMLFKDLIVSDIVYNPRMTRLLQAAKDTGCRIVDGLGMLVYQGAEAFRIWTGIMPPVEEMFNEVLGK